MKNYQKLLAISLVGLSLQASAQEFGNPTHNSDPMGIHRGNYSKPAAASKKMEMSKKLDLNPLLIESKKKEDLAHPYKDYVSCFAALQPPYVGVGASAKATNVVGKLKDIVLISPQDLSVDKVERSFFVLTPEGFNRISIPASAFDTLDKTGALIELNILGREPVLMRLKQGPPLAAEEVDAKSLTKDDPLPVSIKPESLDLKADPELATYRMKEELRSRIKSVDASLKDKLWGKDAMAGNAGKKLADILKDAPLKKLSEVNPESYLQNLIACQKLKSKDNGLFTDVQDEIRKINATAQVMSNPSGHTIEGDGRGVHKDIRAPSGADKTAGKSQSNSVISE